MSALDCGVVLSHSLAYAETLRRRCVVNNERPSAVAKSMGLEKGQCQGAVRLLRNYRPSKERLACIVMLDPGLDNEDIAEIFSQPLSWAEDVRRRFHSIREKEFIPRHLEYLDDGLCDGDPSPSEILERAEAVRASRPAEYAERPAYIKSIHWRRTREEAIPQRLAHGPDGGTEVGGAGAKRWEMRLPREEAGGEEP